MSKGQTFLFVIAVFLAVFMPGFITSVHLINDLRAGCERANVTRENQKFILEYENIAAQIVSELAVDPELRQYFADIQPKIARKADSIPIVDCNQIYSYPFPLDLFK